MSADFQTIGLFSTTLVSPIAIDEAFSAGFWMKKSPTMVGSTKYFVTLAQEIGVVGFDNYLRINSRTSSVRVEADEANVVVNADLVPTPAEVDSVWAFVLFTAQKNAPNDYISTLRIGSQSVTSTDPKFMSVARNALILGGLVENNGATIKALLGESAIWKGIALSSADYIALSAGIPLDDIEPSFISDYWKLRGNANNEIQNGSVLNYSAPSAQNILTFSNDEPFSVPKTVTQKGGIDIVWTDNTTFQVTP
jgi:hypothetical protein